MIRVFRGFLLTAGVLALCAGSAYAQGMGSIFGKVTDPSGGVLPGVTVTVSGTALQRPLTAVTGTTGTYQFPQVPIGTYTVTFELSGFKKAARPNIIVTINFNAPVDQKMEIGQVSEEMTVTAAAPVVDTKKTTTGGTYTKDILENIPTSRDPQQIINMAPGVQLSGINVGGSASGQQLTPQVFGNSNNVQWNLEGGSITDVSSNSSPAYFNFDSFEQIQVTTGGGDVSVQSGGISINLVTKSGSNVFKGTALATFENDSMQAQNVTQELFNSGGNGLLSGNPLSKITNYSVEYGGPIMRNRLWFWGAADRQDINVGTLNFFDPTKGAFCQQLVAAQKQGGNALSTIATYDKLDDVTNCLSNDRTLIKDLEWKFNYQLNAANKIQYLFSSDNKYRNRRNASVTRAQETTNQQTSDAPWDLPLPTHSLTHTLILTDKLVFNNQLTYVDGGFFLDYQDVPTQGSCAQSRYTGSQDASSYTNARQGCLWNVQDLVNSTSGLTSRSSPTIYQTVRHTWEVKTDGTYFLTNKLGGDHSLKFGAGWRKAPILTFSHYSGGARANVQCVGNNANNCGDGSFVGAGSATGFVPRSAVLYRDQLLNNNWWTYNGYIQDGYNRGRLRLQGGVRYDWQTSSYLGGCIPANVIIPTQLPSQCEAATDSGPVIDPNTGSIKLDANGNPIQQQIPAFSVWAPRVSATWDLFGNGKTSLHASYSLYYQTKITLANNLGGLFSQPALTWGNNTTSGACSTVAGASCWNDANHDGIVQANELIGNPASSSSRFNTITGIFSPAGNSVDPNTKLQRTREFVTGVQHELVSNLAIGVDYVYRKYDNGTQSYTAGFQPGSAQYPLSNIYTGPLFYTDPATGTQAPYYVICTGCTRPTAGAITSTAISYQTYQGVIPTLNKRFSNRWQMTASGTFQVNPNFLPTGSFVNPTGVVFLDGNNNSTTFARYVIKVNGVYAMPWGINASANLNVVDGNGRTLSVNGPGGVYGGVNANGTAASLITYNTLTFQPAGSTRLPPTKLLDLSAQKVFTFRGGKNRLKLMLDCFNVFNVNTILGFASNTVASSTFTNPSSIVPPRVFRVGAQIVF
jgi:Carboxypeptidase regulatory-like domain